jgi:hypothetical protein
MKRALIAPAEDVTGRAGEDSPNWPNEELSNGF